MSQLTLSYLSIVCIYQTEIFQKHYVNKYQAQKGLKVLLEFQSQAGLNDNKYNDVWEQNKFQKGLCVLFSLLEEPKCVFSVGPLSQGDSSRFCASSLTQSLLGTASFYISLLCRTPDGARKARNVAEGSCRVLRCCGGLWV